MGNIRFQTAYASAAFIDQLKASDKFGRMLHNGVDIVLYESEKGEQISAHFIDSGLPLYEIRKILEGNAAQGIYTLFLLWADMMLPHNGQRYRADDWMEALYTLYHNTIYGYDVYDGEIFLFPVYFRGEGLVREVEHGTHIDFSQLTTRKVTTHFPNFNDTWLIADFGGTRGDAHDPRGAQITKGVLAEYYALLGLEMGADREAVKQAYRLLARRLHPDVNQDPAAHDQMQQLNVAYTRIIESL